MKRFMLLALLCAGCGSSGPSTTSVSGSVDGTSFNNPSAVFNSDEGSIKVLIGEDGPQLCNDLVTVGAQRSVVVTHDDAEQPSLFLEMNSGHFLGNNLRTVGHDLSASFDPGGGHVTLTAGILCIDVTDGGTCIRPPLEIAESGTAHIDQDSDSSPEGKITTGDFTLGFPDGGALSGTFHATECGALHSACGSVGGSSLLPLLGLGLLARRRKQLA